MEIWIWEVKIIHKIESKKSFITKYASHSMVLQNTTKALNFHSDACCLHTTTNSHIDILVHEEITYTSKFQPKWHWKGCHCVYKFHSRLCKTARNKMSSWKLLSSTFFDIRSQVFQIEDFMKLEYASKTWSSLGYKCTRYRIYLAMQSMITKMNISIQKVVIWSHPYYLIQT